MAQRFELQRVLSMPSPRGVDRIVRSLFEPPAPGRIAVIVTLPLSVDGKRAEGSKPGFSGTSP